MIKLGCIYCQVEWDNVDSLNCPKCGKMFTMSTESTKMTKKAFEAIYGKQPKFKKLLNNKEYKAYIEGDWGFKK